MLIYGKNSIIEYIKQNNVINKIYVSNSLKKDNIISILGNKQKNIEYVDSKKLDEITNNKNHQGVVAIIPDYVYKSIDDIFNLSKEKNEDPFIIILDEIEDPHNLGAIIRTANQVGAHGVIIKKHRSVSVTDTVVKTSAGAVFSTNVVQVTNITNTIKELKERGVWIYGLDMEGDNIYNTDLKGSIALVLGSEGKGITKLVSKNCDKLISIPMKGNVDSLNVSVATGIVSYEVFRQRL